MKWAILLVFQVTKVHKSVGSGMIWELPSSWSYSVALRQAVQHKKMGSANFQYRASSTRIPEARYCSTGTSVLPHLSTFLGQTALWNSNRPSAIANRFMNFCNLMSLLFHAAAQNLALRCQLNFICGHLRVHSWSFALNNKHELP